MDGSRLPEDLNDVAIQTVLADLELALTFAAIAETSENTETRERNRMNARRAFFTIRDVLLPRCWPTESQRHDIGHKLYELRCRLERLGEKL